MAHPTPDLLALVALGEDVDAESLEHIADCRACFAEIESLQQVVVLGRSLTSEDHLVAPHPRVWQRIASSVSDGRAIGLPGAVTLGQPAPRVPPSEPEPVALGGMRLPRDRVAMRRRPWFKPALAAAVALVVGVGGGLGIARLADPLPSSISPTQLNALPRWAGASGTAAVELGADGARTLVVSMELPATVDVDGTLEVWMSDSQARSMMAMGSMAASTTARFPIPPGVDLSTRPIVDVSLEPRGDTDPTHSDTSVVRGRLNG